MNSRATLDEDEMLRKALEISKQEGTVGPSEPSVVRKSKRGREESEEYVIYAIPVIMSTNIMFSVKSDVKRQRTNSTEPSNAGSVIGSPLEPSEAGDDSRRKTPRGTSQSQRGKEQSEPERRRERSETASKRKGRRRADGQYSAPIPTIPALSIKQMKNYPMKSPKKMNLQSKTSPKTFLPLPKNLLFLLPRISHLSHHQDAILRIPGNEGVEGEQQPLLREKVTQMQGHPLRMARPRILPKMLLVTVLAAEQTVARVRTEMEHIPLLLEKGQQMARGEDDLVETDMKRQGSQQWLN
jgi:hypothetical protein